ncbi:MAG TPA: tetratricopeptide repeat protein [Nitrososphaeraceae archaeon]
MNNDNPPTSDEIRNGGLALARRLCLEKKYTEAKRVLSEILKVCNNDSEIMVLMVEILIIENKLTQAKKWLDNILGLYPKNPDALYNLGVFYTNKKQWNKAIKTYEKSIDLYDTDSKIEIADAYQNLGCVLWESRRREEALDAWKTSLQYNPKQQQAKKNLKEFTNEYGLPSSPMGSIMDDVQAFVNIKMEEYLLTKNKTDVSNITDDRNLTELNKILENIMQVWNDEISAKHAEELDSMDINKKANLFKRTKVPFD